MVRRYPVIYQSGLPKELPSGDSVLGSAFRGTTAPASPAAGDLWFDTNTGVDVLKVYNGTGWDSSSGGGSTPPISENDQVISASYSLTADKNGVSVGPITISSGQTLTIPANSRYVVL